MKNKLLNMKNFNFAILFFAFTFGAIAEGKIVKDKRSPIQKVMVSEYKFLDGNTLNCNISSEGPYCDYRRTGSSGLEWPKGSGKKPVFTAGIWLAGVHRPSKVVRMSNMDYTPEFQPGPLFATFNTTTNDDVAPRERASDTKYRLYKINKKDTTGTTGNVDYAEWPGDLGAPFVDVNGNGAWDKGIDKPKFYGDQQIWCVYNDVNIAKHTALSVTNPMGVEIQTLYFVFNQPGALGNMMFMKWKIINKSDADYDSVFIGMWSDPDLGDANDDLPGVDTNLSLGYLYNGDNDDGPTPGYGTKPPAVGFDFFQGPKVPSPNDSALFDGKWRKGFKNLPASSFVVYANGTFPQLLDPPDGTPNYAGIAYGYLNGQAGTIRQYITDPLTGKIVKFFFSGDPVAGTGHLPANFPLGSFAPQDVRIMINAGPFTLAKQDTQEIVGSIILAQGADRLGSVTLLKQVDLIAQQAFNDNFNVPSAPPLPNVKVSELPDKFVFDWTENIAQTESYNYRGYTFQGYNLYQGETQNGPWKKLFTYDKVDGVKIIEDYQVDPVTGNSYITPVAYGDDTGLKYYFIAEKDYLTTTPLVQGKKYYFAFTTYAFNSIPNARDLGIPLVLENAKEVISGSVGKNYLTPLSVPIGMDIPTKIGQLVTVDREGDDAVTVPILSPLALSGKSYRVTFNGTGTNITGWNLLRFSTNKSAIGFASIDTLIKNSADFSGSDLLKPTDGFISKVTNPAIGVRTDVQSPKGYSYTPSYNLWYAGAGGGGLEAFGGGVTYPGTKNFNAKGTKITSDEIKKIEIRFNKNQTQKAFRFAGNLKKNAFTVNPLADSSFIPFVKKVDVGYVYQDRVDVPFTVWEVDPLDGNSTPRQLHVAFLEWNDSLYAKGVLPKKYLGRGNIDGKWSPTNYDDGAKEFLYVFATSYNVNDTNIYRQSRKLPLDPTKTVDLLNEQDSLDIYYIMQVKLKSTPPFAASDGDVFTILPNYRLNATRQYNFTTTKATIGDKELMKTQLGKISVYPNPYFAHNKAEANPLQRFIRINHLPSSAKIRVFTLAGELVKTINYDSNIPNSTPGSTAQWDLRNENGLPVASGMYFIHVEIEGVGTKVLKLAIVQPEERPGRI